MSANAMTSIAVAYRFDVDGAVERGAKGAAEAASGSASLQDSVSNALAVIVTYIPTEVITLYVAVIAALGASDGSSNNNGSLTIAIVFLILSPVVVWLIYAAKLRSLGQSLPWRPRELPLWEMIAATIAFAAWAVSLPDAPFLGDLGLPTSLGAVIVLVTTTVLGLLAQLFNRPVT